jgi:hypothetical protein
MISAAQQWVWRGDWFKPRGSLPYPPPYNPQIRERVETFDAFTPGNNPFGERDFGSFEYEGREVFWKIDDYDRSMECGSDDRSDCLQTTRVLTIMLSSEY